MKVKYKVKNDKLIIKNCPPTLTADIIESIENINNIKEVYLCEGIEKIGENAFKVKENLEKVFLPSSLKKIGLRSFINCSSLNQIELPPNLEEIEFEAFFGCSDLKIITLPSSLKKLGQNCFSHCSSLIEIAIPENIKKIEKSTFCDCRNLEKVILPNSITEIEYEAFSDCQRLKSINMPKSLKTVGDYAFSGCSSLERIDLPEGLKEIGENAFEYINNLQYIYLPKTLKELKKGALSDCPNLDTVSIPESITELEPFIFYHNKKLKNITLPKNLKRLGSSAFYSCHSLNNIDIPEGIKKIEYETFNACYNLKNVSLPNTLKVIEQGAFYNCRDLKEVTLPTSIEKIGDKAFGDCENLKYINIPSSVKLIDDFAFIRCYNLEKVEIQEGLKHLEQECFASCSSLKEITLPSSIETFEHDAFMGCNKLKKINLRTIDGEKSIYITKNLKILPNRTRKLLISDREKKEYSFFNNGEYIKFNASLIEENPTLKKFIDYHVFDYRDYVRLYYWANKKFIPHYTVIKTMPINEIDNFYVNSNHLIWAELLKKYYIKSSENKESFFKLCYVLGVFNPKTSIRDKAVDFIEKNIIETLSESEIHYKFDGFDLSNGFNEEYAEFFMKYFNGYKFMHYINEMGLINDLSAASYNNFKLVKIVYPNKKINTNREADLLLPEHVISAINNIHYENVDEDNEKLAELVGKYGYTQDQFETIQDLFNKAKELDEKHITLHICKDSEAKEIGYELLEKDDPLGAVLGNITNCCQTIGAQGEDCVEYGMVMPNSKFMIFTFKDKIIGQSWVWYDEETQTICLDNIEVPELYSDKIRHNKKLQDSFIKCLLRVERNFKQEMDKKGFKVEKVTIGQGYNDIKEILDKNFKLLDYNNRLSHYSGYSDAHKQYEITKREMTISKTK